MTKEKDCFNCIKKDVCIYFRRNKVKDGKFCGCKKHYGINHIKTILIESLEESILCLDKSCINVKDYGRDVVVSPKWIARKIMKKISPSAI